MKFVFLVFLGFASVYTAQELGSLSADLGPFVDETWYSGTVPMDHDDDIFYWWFELRNSMKDDPVVLWLTGGPGCASEIVLFYENGPYGFDIDGIIFIYNKNLWNFNVNFIYVD
jgi:carboxypeptidase C (cathepsin A)